MTNTNNTNNLQEIVELMFVDSFVSPYQLIMTINRQFDMSLPTQMAYNYCKKGMIKSTMSTTNKLQISKEEAIRFTLKYVSKKLNLNVVETTKKEFMNKAFSS